jgi:hypothetical protein
MESVGHLNELHQMQTIATMGDLSMEQISFIDNPSLNDTSIIDEELIPWDDMSSSDDDNSIPSIEAPDNHENNNSDLGDLPPGQDT